MSFKKVKSLATMVFLVAASGVAQERIRPTLRAASLFPLEAGNYWVYERRGASGAATWRVDVAAVSATAGPARAFALSGYFPGPARRVRVRPLDMVTEVGVTGGKDYLWYLLRAPLNLGWTLRLAPTPVATPGIECIDGAQIHVSSRGEHLEVPAGEFDNVVRVDFATRCVDAGIVTEYFAPGVGLIRREEDSIAGPVISELVESNAGGVRPIRAPYTTSLGLDRAVAVNDLMPSTDPGKGLPVVAGVLTVANDTEVPIVLPFTGCRSATIEVRDSSGTVVLSGHTDDGGCCTCTVEAPALLQKSALALPFSLMLARDGSTPLADGVYAVTAVFDTTEPPPLRPGANSRLEVRSVY
jgi:hypothetical protein